MRGNEASSSETVPGESHGLNLSYGFMTDSFSVSLSLAKLSQREGDTQCRAGLGTLVAFQASKLSLHERADPCFRNLQVAFKSSGGDALVISAPATAHDQSGQ